MSSQDMIRRGQRLESDMAERLRRLERMADAGVTTAETREMKLIAVAAAADMRAALGNYALRGELAAVAEHFYRRVQAAVMEMIEHRKADETLEEDERQRLPGPEWEGWAHFPRPKVKDVSPSAAAVMEQVREEVVAELQGATFGSTRTDPRWKTVMDGLCADARFERDIWGKRERSADRAIECFDRISSILQSMMKADVNASRYDGSNVPG